MMSDLLCGAGTFMTTLAVVQSEPMTAGDQIIVAVVSAVVFFILNIATKVTTSILTKKGIISKEDKQDIDNTAEDLLDDGKINGSNKEDK